MSSVEGRIDAFKFLWPTIKQVSDRLERSAIADEVAGYLNLDRETVRQQFKSSQSRAEPTKTRSFASAVPPNEKLLLACLLASADARSAIRHYLAGSDSLKLLELRPIFSAIVSFDEKTRNFSLEDIVSQLEPHFQRILTEIGFGELPVSEEGAAGQAVNCLRAMEAKDIASQCEVLRRKVREMEKAGDFPAAMAAARELNDLKSSAGNARRKAAGA
jgi:hypothetical protein